MTSDLEVGVRSGAPTDVEILTAIRSDQFDAVADARGGALLSETDVATYGGEHGQRFSAVLDDDPELLAVGTLDGYPFGYGILSVVALGPGRLLATVEELLVAPDAREVGLGETIMNELVRRAENRRCFGIDSRALPGDRQTKNFFESFGLKARLLVVHRALDSGS